MDSAQYNLEVEIDRGARAEALLESLSPYLDQMEETLIEQFKALPVTLPQGADLLKEIKLQHLALVNLRKSITTAVETGRMAFHSLYREETE